MMSKKASFEQDKQDKKLAVSRFQYTFLISVRMCESMVIMAKIRATISRYMATMQSSWYDHGCVFLHDHPL